MPFKISELTAKNADNVFDGLDAGRGHTIERHGNLGYNELVARGISEATCWIHTKDAIAALKEVFDPTWNLQKDLLSCPNSKKYVLNTGNDWNQQVKIRVVEQTKGVAGVKALEGFAKVSVVLVITVTADPGGIRSSDSTVDIITMYPTLREWVGGKPKEI